MKRGMLFALATTLCCHILSCTTALCEDDLATMLVRTTFRIEAPGRQPGKVATGTVFLLLEPLQNSKWKHNVMVTADHVLNDIAGETATVYLTEELSDGSFKKRPHSLRIRDGTTNLWTRHPAADVATMILPLPKDYMDNIKTNRTWVGTQLLVTDETMRQQDLRVGEELCCFGFPFALESSPCGFPILRSGRVASFPVYPTSLAKQILLDMRIFGGNSGGPVFLDLVGRRTFGSGPVSVDWRGVVGVMSQDISHVQVIEGYFESTTRRDPLGLAIVVPAQYIRETIDIMLKKGKDGAEQAPGPVRQ